MKELIRVHKGRMETKYGVDYAIVLDDLKAPRFTQKQAEKLLKRELSYRDSKKKNSEYPGCFDGEVGAYFDYCGYPKNQEWGNVPCYNCVDRTKCNADIFERLVKYEDTEMPPETVAEYKKFEDELVRSGRSFQHILELLEAEKDGRLVILPAKEVYELTWDAGPDCDLICPVSIEGHGCCDMCEKGKVFAYKHTCKQEHIEQLGHNAFLAKEEAEAEAAKINAMYEEEERCTD